jgi:choline kinase
MAHKNDYRRQTRTAFIKHFENKALVEVWYNPEYTTGEEIYTALTRGEKMRDLLLDVLDSDLLMDDERREKIRKLLAV